MSLDRRTFFEHCKRAGIAGTLLPAALWPRIVQAREDDISADTIAEAARVAGLDFSEDEREAIARGIKRLVKQYAAVRAVPLPNDVPPALVFNPLPDGFAIPLGPVSVTAEPSRGAAPESESDIAFAGIRSLAGALRSGTLSATELTRLYLDRLRRFDPQLECVITLTEERALEQAEQADAALKNGESKSLLHGIPWGAKDLLSVAGYPTTWGAAPFKERRIDTDAAVVERLDAAGAVLTAKLTLGALAQGDVWYGGRTNSPWNPKRGSSGSSAGPAAATAAGLVGFSIGSETNGSIVSPSTVCGVTGLRPTFGRVSRHGAMALSWSLDKLGPMCRSAEDCAIVFSEIAGRDPSDSVTVDAAFQWPLDRDAATLRVGYVEQAFDESPRDSDRETLEAMRNLGIDLKPIALPDLPYNELMFVLMAEAAASFDDLTRSGRDDELVNQAGTAWPNTFRTNRFVPAVEYIQANRVRTLLIREMARLFDEIDAYLTPSMHALYLTNLTGHPCVTFPNGFSSRGEPRSISIVGGLYREAEILALAHAFQQQTDFHLRRPPIS